MYQNQYPQQPPNTGYPDQPQQNYAVPNQQMPMYQAPVYNPAGNQNQVQPMNQPMPTNYAPQGTTVGSNNNQTIQIVMPSMNINQNATNNVVQQNNQTTNNMNSKHMCNI